MSDQASVVSSDARRQTAVNDAVRVPRRYLLGVWWESTHKVFRVIDVQPDGRAVIDPYEAHRAGCVRYEPRAGEWPVVGHYIPGLLGWRFIPTPSV